MHGQGSTGQSGLQHCWHHKKEWWLPHIQHLPGRAKHELLPHVPYAPRPAQGGGLCDVDNLRTLCVACHADVTKEQAKERAAGRRQAKAPGAGGGGGGQPGWEDVVRDDNQPVVKRRKKLQRLVLDADESDSPEGSLGATSGQQAAPGGLQAASAAQAAGAAEQGAQRRPRKRLKPLFLESDSDSFEVDAPAGAGADGGAAAGPASAAQPLKDADAAAGTSGQQAAGKLAQRGRTRPRGRLKPLFAEPGKEQTEAGLAAQGGLAEANDAAVTAGSRHRLAHSSTAEEPGPAPPGAAGTALLLQTADAATGGRGGYAANKRSRPSDARGKEPHAARPAVQRKATGSSGPVNENDCRN